MRNGCLGNPPPISGVVATRDVRIRGDSSREPQYTVAPGSQRLDVVHNAHVGCTTLWRLVGSTRGCRINACWRGVSRESNDKDRV